MRVRTRTGVMSFMSVNLTQKTVEGQTEVRSRARDPLEKQREEQLASMLTGVKVFIGGLPVNMDEILVSGVKALDPNGSYHTEIVEKVKRQAVRVLIPAVEATSPKVGSIKEITARLQDYQRATRSSADDVIKMRMMLKDGMTYDDLSRFTGFMVSTLQDLLQPKTSQLKPPATKRGRKLGL